MTNLLHDVLEFTMKRVGISFDESQRALVSKYADDKDETMPQAYSQLLQIGLYHSNVELELPRPEIDGEMVRENSKDGN